MVCGYFYNTTMWMMEGTLCLLTFSIFEIIMVPQNSIIEMGVRTMPRQRFQTLTEQMFYILLCLKEECYGIDIFDQIQEMTEGRVSVGSGTLYNLLEQFLEAEMIREVQVQGRRRSYILTEKGKEMLDAEAERLRKRVADYDAIWGGKGTI